MNKNLFKTLLKNFKLYYSSKCEKKTGNKHNLQSSGKFNYLKSFREENLNKLKSFTHTCTYLETPTIEIKCTFIYVVIFIRVQIFYVYFYPGVDSTHSFFTQVQLTSACQYRSVDESTQNGKLVSLQGLIWVFLIRQLKCVTFFHLNKMNLVKHLEFI